MNIADELTRRIIEAIIEVHRTLGPGFLETIYRRALAIELEQHGIPVSTETEVVVQDRDQIVGRHRLDLIAGGRVIIELKTVDALSRTHYAQLRSYLKATGLAVGLLVNFAGEKADYRRV